MDSVTKARARLHIRNVVIPDAIRRFHETRKLPANAGEDLHEIARRAGMEAFQAHRDGVPQMNEADARTFIQRYLELSETKLRGEILKIYQPAEKLIEYAS